MMSVDNIEFLPKELNGRKLSAEAISAIAEVAELLDSHKIDGPCDPQAFIFKILRTNYKTLKGNSLEAFEAKYRGMTSYNKEFVAEEKRLLKLLHFLFSELTSTDDIKYAIGKIFEHIVEKQKSRQHPKGRVHVEGQIIVNGNIIAHNGPNRKYQNIDIYVIESANCDAIQLCECSVSVNTFRTKKTEQLNLYLEICKEIRKYHPSINISLELIVPYITDSENFEDFPFPFDQFRELNVSVKGSAAFPI